MSLEGKKALVTGAGVRVGRAMALALAQAGCDVIVHYWQSREEADETVAVIERLGRKAVALQADLSDPEAPKILAEQVKEAFYGLDILVNNASVYPANDKFEANHALNKESLADWELALAVNARAPFFLIQHLAPLLEQSADGNVVNILDRSINEVFVSRATHTVSKWALEATTLLASRTFASRIRVNALELGPTLPGEEMTEAERAKKSWSGTGPVCEALLSLLHSQSISGEVIAVSR